MQQNYIDTGAHAAVDRISFYYKEKIPYQKAFMQSEAFNINDLSLFYLSLHHVKCHHL